MALHGVRKEEISRIRREFEQQFDDGIEDIKVPITDFQQIGLKFGRPNTTTVIRSEKK